ncbi:MAG: hypothetical protein GJ680_21230 [Alteromonadaceae bacterium]|nr:hypothetical protein [Alteromonadaceae bacterium]
MSIFENIGLFSKKKRFEPHKVEVTNSNPFFKIHLEDCELFFDEHHQAEDGVIELKRNGELVGRLLEQKKLSLR